MHNWSMFAEVIIKIKVARIFLRHGVYSLAQTSVVCNALKYRLGQAMYAGVAEMCWFYVENERLERDIWRHRYRNSVLHCRTDRPESCRAATVPLQSYSPQPHHRGTYVSDTSLLIGDGYQWHRSTGDGGTGPGPKYVIERTLISMSPEFLLVMCICARDIVT